MRSANGNRGRLSSARNGSRGSSTTTRPKSYTLGAVDNPYLGSQLGLKDILRTDQGEPIVKEQAVICSTIRMGFGHYRIAMAGASCARAMGFTPYWLDLLAIPGITTDVINWCNTQLQPLFAASPNGAGCSTSMSGSRSPPANPPCRSCRRFLNACIAAWPWRFLKTNVKDYKMSELFRNLYRALPSDMPVLTSHMWNCMGAVAGGMTNVVDMMFDNWPMAFQLTEGAKHGVQSPSGYYGFRTMRGFDEHKATILKPMPPEALFYTGHHVDHETRREHRGDCAARLRRMRNKEPRRLLVTMGGAGAQRELFKAIIEHCIPLVKEGKVTLFVNLGDHKCNWDWLQAELADYKDLIQTHFTWDDTQDYADQIRDRASRGAARVPVRQHLPCRVCHQLPDARGGCDDHQAQRTGLLPGAQDLQRSAWAAMRCGAPSAARSWAMARSKPLDSADPAGHRSAGRGRRPAGAVLRLHRQEQEHRHLRWSLQMRRIGHREEVQKE